MTKSTITREQLLEIIETDHVQCGEASYLARMALAAMDSEPVIIVGDDGGDALSYRRLIQSFAPGTKLYRHAQPALVIPDEMTSGQAYEIGYYYGDPVDVFARGANWMRQHIIDSTLAASPQSPGSEPATVPGSWIPVSERMPPSRHEVLVGCWWGEKPRWCCKWATYIPGHPDAQSSGWLIPGASWTPTYWMELPAAPQEVKGE
ncbi:TPA: DUF551 domain-containing protein [Klebsiella quasipneumoniae subsp. similipneumoniae]|nr:DUF551 domain-containing protein [Klebsiella quasipneumoniae subsp. similipneumoniae]HCM6481319.1 DUF551 domain-containing protein [Klebsiella quasipneumoniae]